MIRIHPQLHHVVHQTAHAEVHAVRVVDVAAVIDLGVINQFRTNSMMKNLIQSFILVALTMCMFKPIDVMSQQLDNVELQRMTDQDQDQRKNRTDSGVNIWIEDSIRRVQLKQLIREGKVITAKDHYNAALIFQHGTDTIDSGNAVAFMKKAIELDSKMDRWLLAAAIDRDLMRKGKPQIYGTQYVRSKDESGWRLYDLDTTAVTDDERMLYRVGTLAQQRERERTMNLKSIFDYSAEQGSVEATLQLIREEFAKGKNSTYHVSESEINSYGYEFFNAGYDLEALSIFKLNTELYPKGYNTWDSLGECQLKMGKKKEAYKSYKKSLKLNPANENAKKILEQRK